MTALKTLVLTSTPSSPNRQLHPQLLSPGSRGASSRPGGHRRNKSATLNLPQLQSESPSENTHMSREEKEVYGICMGLDVPRYYVMVQDLGKYQILQLSLLFPLEVIVFMAYLLSCCDLNFR